MGSPVSIYLDDAVLAKLDALVSARAEIDRAKGLTGYAVASRSKLVSEMIVASDEVVASDILTIDDIAYVVVPIAKRFGARRVSLFGSRARQDSRMDSDVDILLDKGCIEGTQVLDFERELASALGRQVNVVTTVGASARFLERIRDDEVTLYEAG